MNSTNSINIPLNIFQTYHTLDLPPRMRKSVNKLIKNNPEFTHYLYDDDDCRKFIKNNFPSNVVNAFDKLIPGAYKADLWRYCVLYIHGGIYLDIKYCCVKVNIFATEEVICIHGDSMYTGSVMEFRLKLPCSFLR